MLAVALVGTSLAFSALGIVVGLYSTGWEQQNVVGNLVIQPLVFLGGVFYSIAALREPWRALTHFDPILYMVVAARHGMLGSLRGGRRRWRSAVTLGLAAIMVGWAWVTFMRGVGIRT